jgi:hypothetical protein
MLNLLMENKSMTHAAIQKEYISNLVYILYIKIKTFIQNFLSHNNKDCDSKSKPEFTLP